MKTKTIVRLLLILAGLAAITAIVMYTGSSKKDEIRMGQLLFEDIDVNAATAIKVHTPDRTFTVDKSQGTWSVKERGGYAADFDKITRFGRKLTTLSVGRAFEYDADTLARLGLKLPDTPGQPKEDMGALFTLMNDKGEEIAKILVGADRSKPSPEGFPMPAGQFVRKGEMKKVYLVDRFFETVDQKPADWLTRSIIKVPASEVASVTCMEIADGKQKVIYELSRNIPGDSFQSSDQQPVKKSEADKLADALSALTLEDVRKVEADEKPEGPFLDYWLFNGTRYRIYKTNVTEEGCEVRIQVSHQGPVTTDAQEEESEEAKSARELNEELAPWAYTLSKWRCGTLATDLAKFLEEDVQD